MKNSFRVLVLILLATLVGVTLYDNKEYKDIVVAKAERGLSAVPVKTAAIAFHPLTTTITLAGKVEGTNEVFVVPTVAGEVERIWVQPGSTVKQGQLLATVNSYYLRQQYQLARTAYEQDVKDHKRLQAMAELKAATGQQLEQYALKVASSETQMKLASRRLEDASIKATVSGTVNQVFTSQGALIGPGRPFCEIVGGPFNVLKSGVQERYRPYLRAGMQVSLRDFQRLYPTKATIAAVGVKPNQMGQVPLEITFEPIDQLYAGKLLDVSIEITTDTGIFIPQEAILNRNGENIAMVAEGGLAANRALILGEQMDGFIRVLSGLTVEDELILEGHSIVNAGDSLRVVSE